MLAMNNTLQAADQGDLIIHSPEGNELLRFPAETATSMRRMLTSLMYQSQLPHSIAYLAALSGEGVTYNTLGIGATLANDIDASICVIELNWWSPGMEAMLSGQTPALPQKGRRKQATTPTSPPPPKSPGVAGILRGEVSLDDALIKTARPNLNLLPAGAIPLHERASVARSMQVHTFISSLRDRYDYVLLDMPALAVTSDTIALASQSEATCLVVLQGATQTNTVKNALDAIKHLPVLGVIMNQVKLQTPRWLLHLLPQE